MILLHHVLRVEVRDRLEGVEGHQGAAGMCVKHLELVPGLQTLQHCSNKGRKTLTSQSNVLFNVPFPSLGKSVTCCWSHRVDFSEVIVGVELLFLSEEGSDVSLQGIIQRRRRGGSLDRTLHLTERMGRK